MTITADQMREHLYTVDEAREILSTTEPLSETPFSVGANIWFKIDPTWNDDLDALQGSSLVNATVNVEGSEFRLTRDALHEATSIVGLPKGYVDKSPAQLIEMQLNFWYRGGMPVKDYKVLSTDGTALAVTRESIQPFSNLRLLDQALDGVQAKYGSGEVYVDKKFAHDLRSTYMRLIIPEKSRVIERTGTDDDTWSLGLQVRNSLIGESQTSLDGYLFRWWCTNGSIDTHMTSGTWSRRGAAGQSDDVYDWARASVDEILGGLEHSFDQVQELVDIPVEGEVGTVLRDVFEQYKIPVAQRDAIIEQMIESDQLNMYAVMQAITATANNSDLKPAHVERLMRVGGDLVHTAHDRCDACRRLMHA